MSSTQQPLSGPQEERVEPPRICIKIAQTHLNKSRQANDNLVLDLLTRAEPDAKLNNPQVLPLITSRSADEVDALLQRAEEHDKTYQRADFNAWYQIYLQGDAAPDPTRNDQPQTLLDQPKKAAAAADDHPDKPGTKAAGPDFRVRQRVDSLLSRLNKFSEVQNAHVMRAVSPPTSIVFPPDGYWRAPPTVPGPNYGFGMGLSDILGAQNVPGSDGAGIKLVDIEQGWMLDHKDLPSPKMPFCKPGINTPAHMDHGTQTMGVIFMQPKKTGNINPLDVNTEGGVGIAPGGEGFAVSQLRPDTNFADAILFSLGQLTPDKKLDRGDVILLEAQEVGNVPVEVFDSTFSAIRLATALGIVVVEAAGNGSTDLDQYKQPNTGKYHLNRNHSDFRDSGAIMVGACTSNACDRWNMGSNSGSCYGSRIDVFAWGENVSTTWGDASDTSKIGYSGHSVDSVGRTRPFFNGTSSASAIIAGATMVLQGIKQGRAATETRDVFSPAQVRELLAEGGSPSKTPSQDRIGVMPNFRAMISGMVGLPDVCCRDSDSDSGLPSTDSLTALQSPDIIIRQHADGIAESQDVLPGQDNYIYVRLLNRGPVAATDVSVDIYSVNTSTLPTPSQIPHQFVGTINFPSPIVAGTNPVMSPALTFPADEIPASGTGYSLIAVAGSAGDEMPNFEDITELNAGVPLPDTPISLKTLTQFVGWNNNVAQRGFDVSGSGARTVAPNDGIGGVRMMMVQKVGVPDVAEEKKVLVRRAEPALTKASLTCKIPTLQPGEWKKDWWIPVVAGVGAVVGVGAAWAIAKWKR